MWTGWYRVAELRFRAATEKAPSLKVPCLVLHGVDKGIRGWHRLNGRLRAIVQRWRRSDRRERGGWEGGGCLFGSNKQRSWGGSGRAHGRRSSPCAGAYWAFWMWLLESNLNMTKNSWEVEQRGGLKTQEGSLGDDDMRWWRWWCQICK